MADFGIAHFEEEELLTAVETRNDERLANFLYSAPEQRIRNQTADWKADIYALGLVLNEMFTGKVPQGAGFRKILEVSQNHPYLDDLIEQMRQHDVARRPSISDLKRELIARGNAFLSVQKLSALKSEVISETEVDDALVRDPIHAVEIDYRDEALIFTLSAAPPGNWIMAFRNPRTGFSYYEGAGPNTFDFQGNTTRVRFGPGMNPQVLVNYTHSYIDLANRRYRDQLTAENLKRIADQKELLRRKIAEEERRQYVLSNIKI